MQNLIKEIEDKVGVTNEQAIKTIEVVADFIKSKFPIFSDAIDKILVTDINDESKEPPIP